MATIRRLLTVLALFLLAGAGVGLAHAEPPQRLDGDVVDRVGALGANAPQVRAALDRLRQDGGVQLFVVYVSSFDAVDGQQWADDSARRSQLGPRDVLLAVAVDDRAYGVSVDEEFPLDGRALDDLVATDVEPRLAAGDWAGAAVALADGLRRGGSSGGGDGATGWVVGGTLALIGGAYALDRRRRRRRTGTGTTDASAEAGADARAGTSHPRPTSRVPPDEFDGVPTSDLAYRASAALLELDDAVRTSEQELDLARAQFGEEAAAGFSDALQTSRAEMVRAFEVRQQLDDEVVEDEPAQRTMLAEIVRTCRSADKRLDAQADAFDRLRDLDRTAPEVIAGLSPALDAADARVPDAQERLAQLGATFAASALAAVRDNVAQARSRLGVARSEVAEAGAALAAGKRGEAVVSARAAEDALAQATTLLDGIGRLSEELTEAGTRIADARAEVELDLAEAAALGTVGELPAVVARARAALAAAERDLAPNLPDPLAALRRLTEAGGALDAGLATAREAKVGNERATAGLDRTLLAARSAVAAASDFVTTRRGAVGMQARTRLAEAQRHLDIATGRAADDPIDALREAQQADMLAQEALRLAQADVDRWDAPQATSSGSTAIDFGSLVLGGILFGDDRGGGGAFGGGRGHRGGGFGGGFFPGSFGGSGTRGRRGTGGRF